MSTTSITQLYSTSLFGGSVACKIPAAARETASLQTVNPVVVTNYV